MHFLRELKEDGIIVVDWMSGDDNPSDLFTKNLSGPLFDKHARNFVGFDEYMRAFANPEERKPQRQQLNWQLRKGGKTKARVRDINYGSNYT
jgi:hypothetical protein